MEPRKDQWAFAESDKDVNLAQQHGVNLLMTLGQSPPWASSRPDEPPAYKHGGSAPPANEDDWKNYVRTVATRYKGKIFAYEIWNEPNLKDFYSGTPEQLVTLAKDAYQIIRQIDPKAIIVLPSITASYGVKWLNSYLDAGGGQYADVIGYHFYVTPNMPEATIDLIRQVQAALTAHGIQKPIWNTEMGWLTKSNFQVVKAGGGSLRRVLNSDEQLAYVMRAYIMNWAAGVSRVYWYDWDSNQYGLGDNLGKQKKSAADGYKTIEEWLVGATMRSCSRIDDGSWTCELNRDGKSRWLVWNSDYAVDEPVPADWKVKEVLSVSPAGTVSTTPLGDSKSVQYGPIPSLLQ